MNGFKSRGLRVAIGTLALACLAACGGGGGGDSSSNKGADVAPSSTATATVSGVASKGLMKNAIVKVFEVAPDGRVQDQLGQTVRTDATGHYSVANIVVKGVVLVEVSADAGTLMVDEATGTEVTPPAGFKMRAATSLSGSGTHTVHVTPFSEMAMVLAAANGSLTADLVAAANQKIVAFTALDVLSTEPTFDASNKPSNPVAVTLAAVSHMAKNGDFAGCKTKPSVAEKVACTVSELAKGGASSQEIATKLEAAKQQAKQGYIGSGAVPPVATQPAQLATSAVKDAITEAKSLISNVRANAASNVTDDLRARVQQVTTQFSANISPVEPSNQILVMVSAKAVAIQADPVGELGAFTSADITLRMGRRYVTCTLFSDEQATTRAVNLAGVKAVRCVAYQAGAYASGYLSDGLSWTTTTTDFQHDVLVRKASVAGQYQVQTQLFSVGYSYGNKFVNDQNGGHYESWNKAVDRVNLSAAMVAQAVIGTLPNGHVNAVSLRGDMAPGVDSHGAFEDKLTVDIALASQAETDVVTRLALEGRMTAFKGGKTGASVALLPGSYVRVQTKAPGDVFAGLKDDVTAAAVHVELEGSVPEGTKAKGTLDITDFVQTAARNGPTAAVFKGTLYQSNGAVLFSGEASVTAPVDPVLAPNQVSAVYAGWDMTVVGRLPLLSRPDLAISVTVSVPSSATQNQSRNTFAGSYMQGTDTVLFSGLADELKPSEESLTLSTPSGVTVTVKNGQDTFPIKKGSAVIGVFYQSSGKIIYADNSYEQF